MATSGERVLTLLVAACLAGTGSACSPGSAAARSGSAATSSAAPGPSPAGSPAPTPSSAGTASGVPADICLAPAAAAWHAGSAVHPVRVPGASGLTVNAVSAGRAFGQAATSRGEAVVMVDLATGALTRIAPLAPTASGITWMSVDLPWVVWTQGDSTTDLFDWSVHAWNASTGRSSLLATTAAPGGGKSPGQQGLPVVTRGRAAWAQPVGRPGDTIVISQLRVVDLASGRSRTLAEGRLSSPVASGRDLVWASLSGSGQFELTGVDAATLAPVSLPPGLAKPGTIGFLGGTPEVLAWSSSDGTTLTVWSWSTGSRRVFRSRDGVHFFQYLQLAGPYLAWFAAGSSAVLDLRVGAGFDVHGTVAAAGDVLVVAGNPPGKAGGAPGTVGGGSLSRVDLSRVPRLAPCS